LVQQAKSFRIKLDEPIWGEVSYIGRSLASRALFYGACLSRFRRQFGLVDAQLYQRRSFPGGNVVASFADRVGISTLPGLTLSLEAEANRSLGWKGVALSIAIAEQNSRAIGSRLHRAALITAAATMARCHEDDTWIGRRLNFLTADDIAAINHLHAEDTVKLSKRFFGGSQPFKPAAAAPVDPFGPAHLGAGELVEAMSLYRRALIIEAPTVALTSLRRITE
jgi:hypothetical protein